MSTIPPTTRVYENVIEHIKQMIIQGKLKKGDKLPSERELAEQLKVSRTSVREAIKALQIIGLINCRRGGGNYIASSIENSLFEPLSIMFMLEESSPDEIFELRKVVEVETAALAAKKITEEELIELNKLIEKLKVVEDKEEKNEIDKEIHYLIAKASKNFLIFNVFLSISSLVKTFIEDARDKILKTEQNKKLLMEQHTNIYNALKIHDSNKAAFYMREHLETANEYIVNLK